MFGIPDPYWVEKVHAVVVLNSGFQATDQEIIAFCKERLARFKAPKSLEFVAQIPKNPQPEKCLRSNSGQNTGRVWTG